MPQTDPSPSERQTYPVDTERGRIQQLVIGVTARTLKRPAAELDVGQRFDQDLGADSVCVVEIVLQIENALGKSIPDDVMPLLLTIEDIVSAFDSAIKDDR